ncbi:hypothetical protein FB381_0607 [Nocardioides albertanoniae]|uniref:PIN domain-containing protein n=1 Tax=Nocardioides albertanoniae TaxID=1175486 RepID=A0A543A2C9_9ACTN|nr:type II toxin-antitoxin system VapC family toxin [Nocardioides albertanoniae]TQL66742.1 hypothetical protein FB381_0607 [Nocardioides albertanoniae]
MLVYVDTSAVLKLLIDEPESDALEGHLNEIVDNDGRVISSELLDVELTRVALRSGIARADVDAIVQEVHLMRILPEVIAEAKDLTQSLKSLDAIHVGTASLLMEDAEGDEAIEQLVTYDRQMASAAEELGLEVVSPGRST